MILSFPIPISYRGAVFEVAIMLRSTQNGGSFWVAREDRCYARIDRSPEIAVLKREARGSVKKPGLSA